MQLLKNREDIQNFPWPPAKFPDFPGQWEPCISQTTFTTPAMGLHAVGATAENWQGSEFRTNSEQSTLICGDTQIPSEI